MELLSSYFFYTFMSQLIKSILKNVGRTLQEMGQQIKKNVILLLYVGN